MRDTPPDIREGLRRHQAGDLTSAAAIYRQVLEAQPDHADALHLVGVVAYQQGAHRDAIESIQKAIELAPASAAYYNNLGAAQRELNLFDDAIASFQRAADLDANYVEARFNLGNVLQAARRLDEAVAAYRTVLAMQPQHVHALNNLGAVFQTQSDLARATECYQRVLAIDDKNADSWHNLGLCLDAQDRLTEAEESFRRALACRPAFADAYNSLGSALRIQGRNDDARDCFEQALELAPDHRLAQSNALMVLDYAADVSPQEIFEHRCRWGDAVAGQFPPQTAHTNRVDADRPLRIGYISPDFRQHAVASFIEPILSHHGDEFVTICYADVPNPDSVTARLQALVGTWRNIVGRTDEQVARQIVEDGIDILVDLAGHTAGNRLRVFARKPAPVQVTYLGDSTTTGLAAMDYRISDVWADPWYVANVCRETLIRLPGGFLCFRPSEAAPAVGSLPAADKGYITFGSFNSLAKVTPDMLRVWAELLRRVPGSRLVLKNGALRDTAIRQRIEQQFVQLGVPAERVELLGHVESAAEHFALYNRIDIGLDTFPYGGTTTTCEALWMGVPVVTLAGATHVSRVGASLLSQIGLDDMVARNAGRYLQIAADLAGDPQRLAALRSGLRDVMGKSSLCDAPGFTRRLEAAYRAMWRAWCEMREQPTVARAG